MIKEAKTVESITLQQIAAAVGAGCEENRAITGVSIDTAQVKAGDLFVAIKGERFDGHDFAKKAEDAGAAAILSGKELEVNVPVLQVPSTRQAFIDLAAYYRSLFQTFVVGVTGSVGKTSTKDMIYAVLSAKGKTLKTQGNLNNGIGLPKTLLGLDSTDVSAVIEMGMSHPGEIAALTRAARPYVGLITNIGVYHIENLGSQANILKAKLEIVEGMGPGSPLVLNGDDPLLAEVANRLDRDIIYYGIDSTAADVRADSIVEEQGRTLFQIRFYGKTRTAAIPTVGRHNVYNALAAFSVGLAAGMAPEDITEGLSRYEPSAMRQDIRQAGGITVVIDCYNASPDSMRASLEVLGKLPGKRHVAVLADMLELGEFSQALHQKVGEYAAENRVDGLFCYGSYGEDILAGAQAADRQLYGRFFDAKEELGEYLRRWLKPGDVVLYKGSRGMKLEEVIKAVHGISAAH